jgi:mono/diheme cytochrome c family protein
VKKTLVIVIALVCLGTAGAAGFVRSGFYDISAIEQHLPPTYWLIERVMQHSVARRAATIVVPSLGAPRQVARGNALYREHCVQCHGAPGVAPEPFALGLTPLPVPLAQTGREWPPSHIFYVVKFGIKMTGMPAWTFRMSDEDIWAVVAFVKELPLLSPRDYAGSLPAPVPANEVHAADRWHEPERGKTALQQYGCVACHLIPGVTGPPAHVGPPLAGIASRSMLGGILRNTPQNLMRWIRSPQKVSPLTAMPDLGVTERDARAITAYLATLK